ncbi:hypothetical protein JTB14_015800 [Gonioctena quinquepunctata]|nr:hypothetical protein JTB14_015800 [Gonioctena quinquepunctata]
MRSTLQTVPESLEVTKNADPISSVVSGPAKTPVKTVSEAANKSSRSYNYHTSSSTNKVGRLQRCLVDFYWATV